jgi:hypothetical protein
MQPRSAAAQLNDEKSWKLTILATTVSAHEGGLVTTRVDGKFWPECEALVFESPYLPRFAVSPHEACSPRPGQPVLTNAG